MILDLITIVVVFTEMYLRAYVRNCCNIMLNKNTWGVKKREANQKQHASRQVRPKALISAEAKKLLYQKTFNS